MTKAAIVPCVMTPAGIFVSCPVCRSKKLMQIMPETAGKSIVLYCGRCKARTVVDIRPGEGLERVTISAPDP